jgi:hypothetical protein
MNCCCSRRLVSDATRRMFYSPVSRFAQQGGYNRWSRPKIFV